MAEGSISELGGGFEENVSVTRYLLDTGIASDYIDRRNGVYQRARRAVAGGGRLGIAAPVLGELWTGIFNSTSREHNQRLLRRHRDHFAIWPFEENSAKEFGRIMAELIRIGRKMQQIDMQIAAIALSLGNCVVVSKDGDLRAVPGLEVEDWSQP